MRCLTLHQPWASLIFGKIALDVFKRYETRSWVTNYTGPLLIHASVKHFSEIDARNLFEAMGIGGFFHHWWYMPYGKIIGRVNLTGCIPTSNPDLQADLRRDPQQRRLGDFSEDRFAWKLEDPVFFEEEAIPWRGAQRLFYVPDRILQERGLL